MEGIGHHPGQAAVGLHRGGHVKGFQGNLDLVEVLLFQQADLPQGGGHHVVDNAVLALPGLARLGQLVHQVHVPGESPGPPDAAHRREAAEVHADADGDLALLGRPDHLPHLALVAQIARVEAQAVHTAFDALQG